MDENKLVKYDNKAIVKVGGILSTTEKLLALTIDKSILPPRKPMILVVDDEKATRDALEEILTSEGYNVMSAIDGLEACNLLNQFDGTIDLICTGLKMPKMDGFELIEKLPSIINHAISLLVFSGIADIHLKFFNTEIENNERIIKVGIISKGSSRTILIELLNSIKIGVELVKIRRKELGQL